MFLVFAGQSAPGFFVGILLIYFLSMQLGWLPSSGRGGARTTLDVETRYNAYQAMLDIWEDEAPATVLYDPAEFYGVSKSVNWNPYPLYNMDLRAYNLSLNEE
jgi:hypothetical protein